MTGRPSTYSEDIAAEIVKRISEGEPLAQICRDEHMPGVSTVYDWMKRRGDLSGAIARAREAGFDVIATDCLKIADDPEGDPQRDKLRVDTRLKLLAKWDPKRYGEAVQLKHSDAEGQTIDLSATSAAARLAALLEAVRNRAAATPLLTGSDAGEEDEPSS